MFWNKPKLPKSAVKEFERELSGVVLKGRLLNVPAARMIQALDSHVSSMRREIQHARDNRNLRTTPVRYDGYGKPVTQC
jgi:hypothetical protein